MKRLTIILIAIIFFYSRSEAQDSLATNDPIVLQIQSLNLSQFVGQPVDTLLAHLPSGYTLQMQVSIVAKKAGYLVVNYAPYTYVYIAVRNFNYMNPELSPTGNPTQNWNITHFKKEAISFATAFNGSCINGCQHQQKFN